MDKQKKETINQIILAIQKREDGSLNILYDLISQSIRFISLKYMKNEEDAKDLEQDFWANIYHIADKFTYFKNGFSYLCKVMTRMAINRYKKLYGEQRHITEYVDYSRIQEFDENILIDDIDVRLVVGKAVANLDKIEAIIVQLTIFEDKTLGQIARELKMSKSTVGRKKLAAFDKLKTELFEYKWEKVDR